MSLTYSVAAILLLTMVGFFVGRSRAVKVADGRIRDLHSRVGYYGTYAAMWIAIPCLLLFAGWVVFEPVIAERIVVASLPPEIADQSPARLKLTLNTVYNIATGNIVPQNVDPAVEAAAREYTELRSWGHTLLFAALLALGGGALAYAYARIRPHMRARNRVEKTVMVMLIICSIIAILTTAGIVLSLLFESAMFFTRVSVFEFLFGLHWSPQTALRADQVGSSGSFGAIPLFVGTAVITVIAMLVAVPVGLMSAIYMSDYAPPKVRAAAKPMLEILAGVPTVVYGFFAALTVAPFIRNLGESVGLSVTSESALAAGIVMGIMIIPFVSSLSDDVINAVPQSLRDGSYALGATKSETIRLILLPAALPGIVGAVLLAVSRAVGETMIVVMAAGIAANLTINPLDSVTTVTVQIVKLLTGDQEFDSAKTLSAFALGLTLFCITLLLNVAALRIVRKYREKYD